MFWKCIANGKYANEFGNALHMLCACHMKMQGGTLLNSHDFNEISLLYYLRFFFALWKLALLL